MPGSRRRMSTGVPKRRTTRIKHSELCVGTATAALIGRLAASSIWAIAARPLGNTNSAPGPAQEDTHGASSLPRSWPESVLRGGWALLFCGSRTLGGDVFELGAKLFGGLVDDRRKAGQARRVIQ